MARTLVNLREITATWTLSGIGDPDSPLVPQYRNVRLPACGEKIVAPPPSKKTKPAYDDHRACDETYCDLNPRVDPPEPVFFPLEPPACDESADAVDPSCSSDTLADSNGPHVYINEFMPFKTEQSGLEEFIELRKFPNVQAQTGKNFINLHKLVAFTAYSHKLLLVVNVHQKQVNEHGLVAIKADDTKQLAKSQKCKLLPQAKVNEPIVLLLLRKTDTYDLNKWRSISLSLQKKTNEYVEVDLKSSKAKAKNMLQNLKDTVVDGYIYGNTINTAVENDVRELLKVGQDCNFILFDESIPGMKTTPATYTMSFNLCPINGIPVKYDKNHVKLGNATMDLPNDCQNSMPFLLDKIEQPRSPDSVVGVTKTPRSSFDCVPSISSQRPNQGDIQKLINYNIDYIKTKFNENYTTEFWPNNKFKSEVMPDLMTHGFDAERHGFPDITPFEIVPDEDRKPEYAALGKTWRCKVCHQRLLRCPHSFHHKGRSGKLVQKSGEQMPTSYRAAQTILTDHVSEITHYHSILYSIRADRRRLEAEKRIKQIHDPVLKGLIPLANVMLVAFTFAKTNTAMKTTDTWYKTLNRIEANVGQGAKMHSRETTGAMIKHISLTGFNRIFNHLVETKAPFSLILDGASDITHNHYVCVFIQSNEGYSSLPYFAGVIRGTKSSTSEAHVTLLKLWAVRISEHVDGFYSYFIENLVAVATDSAPTMIKMHSLIQEWINEESKNKQTLLRILCLAHKLNLATRSALVPLKRDGDYGPNDCLKYFKNVEKMMQSTYTWITLASRRLGEYRDIQISNKEPTIELKELHIERWIASEHKTCKYFIGALKTVHATLRTIMSDDENYLPKVRSDAEDMLEKLSDKTLLITIIFLQDYTAVFKVWSEKLQRFVGLYSDQMSNFEKLNNELEILGEFQGSVLNDFLMECKCSASSNPDEKGCEVEDYEASDTVIWRTMTFKKTDEDAPNFMQLAKTLMRKTDERLRFYLDVDLMENINVFSPARFPASIKLLSGWEKLSAAEDIPVFERPKIHWVAKKLGLDANALTRDWAYLMISIMNSKAIWDNDRKVLDTEGFWSQALREDTLNWTPRLRHLIKVIKTITIGSTLVESAFSVFNTIKVRRRSKIGDDMLQAIMNLVINAPADVDLFDSFDYAIEWNSRGRQLPGEESKCIDEQHDESINMDPSGVGEVDLEHVDEELPVFNLDHEPHHMEDAYSEYLKSKPKDDDINRIRTLLM